MNDVFSYTGQKKKTFIFTLDTPAGKIIYFLNFQNYREHVYKQLVNFKRNPINCVCSYTGQTKKHSNTYVLYMYISGLV